MIGFDTTAIIDFFKKDEKLKTVMEELDDDFVSTIINYQEIFFGINQEDRKYESELIFYEGFFNDIILLNLNKVSIRKSSIVFWNLKKKRINAGKFDSMIAGILLSNGVNKIITKNVKHFKKIEGLKVISY